MKLTIPYNGDLEYLRKLKKKKYPIEIVYGKLPHDIIGGGRAKCHMYGYRKYDAENLQQAVRLTHELGAEFDYLFNASCSGNAEFEEELPLLRTVEKLAEDFGIDRLTVASPFLLRTFKKHFPSLKYGVSKIARVNNLQKIKLYEDLGADEITLDYSIQRNFSVLREIIAKSSVELKLIVNDACKLVCPYSMYHYLTLSHNTRTEDIGVTNYFDICRYSCLRNYLLNGADMIKIAWIRPEDLHYYEEIGFSKFKLIGRLWQTPRLMKAIEAYSQENYQGNLCDIFGYFLEFPEYATPPVLDIKKIDFSNLQNLKAGEDFKPYIDNQELSKLNFLDYFVKNKIDCSQTLCRDCAYCEGVFNKAGRRDSKSIERVIGNLNTICEKWFETLAESKPAG